MVNSSSNNSKILSFFFNDEDDEKHFDGCFRERLIFFKDKAKNLIDKIKKNINERKTSEKINS